MAIGPLVIGTLQEDPAQVNSATPYAGSPALHDLMVELAVNGSTSPSAMSMPGGWTQLGQDSQGGTASPAIGAWRKFAVGTESGTVTLSHGSALVTSIMACASGVDQTTPIDITPIPTNDPGVASSSITISGTVATAGSTIILWATTNSTSTTLTGVPAGFTAFAGDSGHHTSGRRSLGGAYIQNVAAGATGNLTLTFSGSAKSLIYMIVLRPAVTSSPVSVTGTVSDLIIAAPAGSVSTQTQISLTGVAAALTIAALAGSVAVQQNVSLTGTVSNVTLSAPPGSIATQRQVSLTGAVGTLLLGAPAGSISTGGNVNLTGTVSALTIAAPAGTVSVQRQVSLSGAVANVSLVAPAGTVATVRSVALTGATSSLVLTAPAGTVTTPAVALGLPELVKAQVILRSADAEVIPRTVRTQPATRTVGASKIARTVRAQPITRTVEEST